MHNVRDIVIDWLHCHTTNLLADDVLAEGIMHLVTVLVRQAAEEQAA